MRDGDYNGEEATGASELYDGPFDMPARLLGHLAVDKRFKNEGLGEYLENTLSPTRNNPTRHLG